MTLKYFKNTKTGTVASISDWLYGFSYLLYVVEESAKSPEEYLQDRLDSGLLVEVDSEGNESKDSP